MTTPDRRETIQPDYRTVAVMRFGDTQYLVRENESADVRLELINPQRDALKYHKQTKTLPQESIFTFENVDAPRVTIAQIGMQAPQVRWAERTSAVDEPTILYPGTHAIKGEQVTVEMYEPELHDLFLPKPGQDRRASFITMNTTSHELIGITLKRPSPVMMLLTPGKDGMNYSPHVGLRIFIDNIYEKLRENLTAFQAEVNRKVYSELGPTGAVAFTSEANSPTKQRQREIQKRIYQIQALLLAANAEKEETLLQDPSLLAHAPFLEPTQQKSGGFFDKLKSLGNQDELQQQRVKVGNKIWENLVSAPSGNLLRDPQAEAARRVQVQPATPVFEHRPASNAASLPQTTSPHQPVRSMPEPVRRMEPRPLTEKEQAIALAQGLHTRMENGLQLFKNLSLDQLGPQQVVALNQQIENLATQAKEYTIRRRKGKAPDNPVAPKISAKQNTLDIAGIKDARAFEFLSGDVEGDYKAKAESIFSAWGTYVRPLYVDLNASSDRKYSAVKHNTDFRQEKPDVYKKLFIEAEKILNALGPKRPQDMHLAAGAHVLLGEQLLYTLGQQYEQIKARGQAVEIDNWASYCHSTLSRFKELLPQAMETKKKR